ncbi:hypothetical protein MRX96_048616 [Rhipicephalus microplus]
MWMDLDSGIRIVNVYAPGDFHSQKEFFAELDNHLVGPSRVALVGDFNCVLGPIDRRTFRGTPPKWSDRRSKGVLRELVDDLGLIDAWRALRSAQSGMNSTGRNARSRIDRFYVSPSLAPSTHSSWLVSSALSDHSLLILRLAGTDIAAQGKRPWRLNARLLNDREILVDVARLIQRKVAKRFYENLYAEPTPPSADFLFVKNDQVFELCDSPIVEEELHAALVTMKRNRIPGTDGLTVHGILRQTVGSAREAFHHSGK